MTAATEASGPARLTLLCHASTDAVRSPAFPLDEGLDDRGRAAAAALAGTLPVVRTVVASPTRRTLETVTALGLKAAIEPALRDCDYGRWTGSDLSEIAAAEPDALAQWLADPDAAPHGGESVTALLRRVATWMDSGALAGRVLAVTHASVIRAAILHAIGAPARSFWRIDAPPLSTVELHYNSRQWSLRAH